MPKRTPLDRSTDDLSVNLSSESAQQQERRRRSRMRLAWTVVIVGIIGNLVVGTNAVTILSSPADSGVVVTDSPGRAAATVEVQRWLTQEPQPLPGGRLLSWDDVEVVEPDLSSANEQPYTLETHQFTLASAGAIFDAVVTIRVDADSTVPIAEPSLLPRLASASSVPENTTAEWTGYDSVQVSSEATQAVRAWADAFTSGNVDELAFITRDDTQSRIYVPLTGVVASEVAVVGGGVQGESDSTLLARVLLSVSWAGQVDEDGEPIFQTAAYDLLIEGASGGSPRVVSWGGAGTGPALSAYSVGIEGIDIDELPEPSTSPSGTPIPTEPTPIDTEDEG